MTIYVVIGSAGEYSDRREWLVRALPTEEQAKAEVLRIDTLARQHEASIMADKDGYDEATRTEYWELKPEGVTAWMDKHAPGLREADPLYQRDYSGTRYRYESCPCAPPPAAGGGD